jgi:hypothetical protein
MMRFTVRRMMFAVAIISVALGTAVEADRVWRFREDCFLMANAHGTHEAVNGSVHELNGLAWFLATCPDAKRRDGRRAVELAGLACELTRRKAPSYLVTLAAACAECGEFGSAVQTQREAVELLSDGDPKEEEYRARVEHYEAKRPFRDVSKMGKALGS